MDNKEEIKVKCIKCKEFKTENQFTKNYKKWGDYKCNIYG